MKILKYVISIGLLLAGFRAFFESSVLMGIIFCSLALIIFPVISEKLKDKIPLWQNKYLRYGTLLVLLILGGASKNKSDKEKVETSPEFIAEKFFNENKNNEIIKIADTLLKLDDYFDSEDSKKYLYKGGFRKVSENEVIYRFLDIKKDSLFRDYQNSSNGKYLIDYSLLFEIKDKKVVNVKATALYNDGTKKEFTKDNYITVSSLIKTEEVKKMKIALAKLEEAIKQNKELEERKANFEKECFTGLDGYNLSLVRLVKENLHDPDSFEHVETRFKLMDDCAIVVMKYRAKNGFNAIRLEEITAKINFDCEVVEVNE